MTVEAMPLKMACNLRCTYCYQNASRGEEKTFRYDVDKMLGTLERLSGKSGFTVFGGEPLMIPMADLERFLARSYELSGGSDIQTNGSLLAPAHVELFKKYKTRVGVSADGPGVLNRARRLEMEEATDAATDKTMTAMGTLLEARVPVSLIITLHKLNATRERLQILMQWLAAWQKKGLTYVRLHLMEVDSPEAAQLKLTDQEAIEALITLHAAEPTIGCSFDIFDDMLALLRAKDEKTACIWNGCDPGTTGAVQAVGPQGEQLNCARTYKTQTTWMKADSASHMRQVALYQTPYEDGGCKDCRFFVACKGQCPGEAIDGDPRNRSSNCKIWFTVLEYLERHLLCVRDLPVSLHPDRVLIERIMLAEWQAGYQITVQDAVAIMQGKKPTRQLRQWHGDHSDQMRRWIRD